MMDAISHMLKYLCAVQVAQSNRAARQGGTICIIIYKVSTHSQRVVRMKDAGPRKSTTNPTPMSSGMYAITQRGMNADGPASADDKAGCSTVRGSIQVPTSIIGYMSTYYRMIIIFTSIIVIIMYIYMY